MLLWLMQFSCPNADSIVLGPLVAPWRGLTPQPLRRHNDPRAPQVSGKSRCCEPCMGAREIRDLPCPSTTRLPSRMSHHAESASPAEPGNWSSERDGSYLCWRFTRDEFNLESKSTIGVLLSGSTCSSNHGSLSTTSSAEESLAIWHTADQDGLIKLIEGVSVASCDGVCGTYRNHRLHR